MRRMACAAALMVVASSWGQQAPASYPPLSSFAIPGPASAPMFDPEGYEKAERCVKAYAVRFAQTTALPQDVADAALAACEKERSQAARTRARGSSPTMTLLQVDEPDLRRAAIRALLEARFQRAR